MYFNLQYKKFLKRIFDAALDPTSCVAPDYLSSRDGVINVHSLVWNQFASENYTDMIRYAWHDTDPHFSLDELNSRPKPKGVVEIQFSFEQSRCEHIEHGEACNQPAFIQCSHCRKILCLKHFLERACFHEAEGPRAGPSHELA